MQDKPDDRLKDFPPKADEPAPKIYLVVDGEKFVRPGLETYYASVPDTAAKSPTSGCSCFPVSGTFCSCNKVCTCNTVCTCQGHAVCTCESYRTCSCQTTGSVGGGTYCSCNKICSCVPVH